MYRGFEFGNQHAAKDPKDRFTQVRIGVTPWLLATLKAIAQHENMSLSRAARALMFLGYARYKELGALPELDR